LAASLAAVPSCRQVGDSFVLLTRSLGLLLLLLAWLRWQRFLLLLLLALVPVWLLLLLLRWGSL
jgi:hypothetical protein